MPNVQHKIYNKHKIQQKLLMKMKIMKQNKNEKCELGAAGLWNTDSLYLVLPSLKFCSR